MAQTTLNVRMDEEVKKGLEKFCYEVGLNVSVAVNMFAKAVVREQRLPFDVALNVPNASTLAAMEEVEEMLKTGSGKGFNSMEELLADLNS
jgi:DNA-damage-inducible protein J